MSIKLAGGFISVAIFAAPVSAAPFIVPTLGIAVLTDDNVLMSFDGQPKDVITRVSPGVELGVESERLLINASYNQDMESYQDNPDLDSNNMRRFLKSDIQYRLNELILFSIETSISESQFPAELNISTGAGEGRVESERTEINPALSYRFSPTSSAQIDYRHTQERIAVGIENITDAVNVDYEHALTANTQMTYGYTFSHFEFDNAVNSTVDITEDLHTPRVGVFHNINSSTTFSIQVGPSFTTNEVGANIATQLQRSYSQGQFAIGYNRSAGTLIGEPGLVEIDAFNGSATHRFGNNFELSGTLSFGKVHQYDSEFSDDSISRASLSARYRVNDYASITASYSVSEQRIFSPTGSNNIPRNVAMLALTLTYPRRSAPTIFSR
jgi:hypothetical protein